MHDLDDLLARRDRFRHRLTGGLVLHPLDEIARDRQRHVGLKQGHAHLAQRLGHVGVAERALFGQPFKDAAKAF